MKTFKNELDVDFIGGQGPLTKEEELAISAFIRAGKEKHQSRTTVKKKTVRGLKRQTRQRA